MQTTPSMNWGRKASPRPCTPRNERNLPRIRSLLHVAPISQNDQPQRIERKLLAQTVRTDGQSLSHSRWSARHLNTYKAHSFVPIAQQTVNSRANCRFRGIFVEQFNSIDLVLINFHVHCCCNVHRRRFGREQGAEPLRKSRVSEDGMSRRNVSLHFPRFT